MVAAPEWLARKKGHQLATRHEMVPRTKTSGTLLVPLVFSKKSDVFPIFVLVF
jgi:hypothetical protein